MTLFRNSKVLARASSIEGKLLSLFIHKMKGIEAFQNPGWSGVGRGRGVIPLNLEKWNKVIKTVFNTFKERVFSRLKANIKTHENTFPGTCSHGESHLNAAAASPRRHRAPSPTGKTTSEVLVAPFTGELPASAPAGSASVAGPCPASSWLQELA